MRKDGIATTVYEKKKPKERALEDLIIKIENLVYEYRLFEGSARALDGIDLEIERGSFTAIIGHNGSGKSTLAKHLNALILPTSGKVYIDGMDTMKPERLWDIRKTAGMVFQNPDNQLVATIVEEDVAFGPENLGMPRDEILRNVSYALHSVEMEAYSEKAPHMLSGGQKQRVAIAGIIAMRPKIIILDEPTAMLDPRGRKDVMDTVKKLNKEGITVVHITHFLEEAGYADRVIVMNHGKIALDGNPEEVFSHGAELKELGLDIPPLARLADILNGDLQEKGIAQWFSHVMDPEEMVEKICRLL